MKTIISSLLVVMLTVFSFVASAHAISLDAAKKGGLVGELSSGYLGAVQPASPETQMLISEVNAARKAKYAEIAQKNGTSVAAVEALAATKAAKETAPGNYVQSAAGEWKKK